MEIKNTKRTPVKAVIDDFTFCCQYERNLSKKTIAAYNIDLHQWFSFLSKLDINDIESVGKEAIKTYLQEISHFKIKTIKRKIASLKAMFNFWEYENDDFINPFRKIRIKLKEAHSLPSVMVIGEVKQILDFVYKEKMQKENKIRYSYNTILRDIAVLELLFATGIRVSELCDLKEENIDLKSGEIKITGKGNKERYIQIYNKETKMALKIYFQKFETQIKKSGFFFVNRLHNQLSTQSVRLMIHQKAQKAGLTKKITPHTFRHTFATLLLEENVDIRYIQGMLGHSTITTTQLYTHISTEKQRTILKAKHPRQKFKFEAD